MPVMLAVTVLSEGSAEVTAMLHSAHVRLAAHWPFSSEARHHQDTH